MMTATTSQRVEVLGHLFGWPIRESLFFGQPCLTESMAEDVLSDVARPQGHTSNTFSVGSTFQLHSSTLGSATVVGNPLGRVWAERIETRLMESEARAASPIEREEYQLARRVLRRCFYDNCTNAYFLAFCWFYGGSPEIIARKQEHYRQFMLRGSALKLDDKALPPKKPAASVQLAQKTKEKA